MSESLYFIRGRQISSDDLHDIRTIIMFWLSVNRTFGSFVTNHHERRKVHAKETSLLHPGREGFHFTASLVEHTTVSDLCDELQLQPKIFYIWQKQLFENGDAAFTASY